MVTENQGNESPRVTVRMEVDDDQFRAEMQRVSAILREEMGAALDKVVAEFRKSFQKAADSAEARLLNLAGQASKIGQTTGRNYSASFESAFDVTNTIENQLRALQGSASGRRSALDALGLDPRLLASVDNSLEEVTRQYEVFRQAAREGLSVEEAIRYQRSIESTMERVRAELRETELVGRSFVQQQRANSSANTAQFQQETTLQNALIRSNANLQIQESQRAGRARIEIARFAFRQIQFFEQQIARAVRGTFSALGGLVSGAASGVARLAGVFRRSNRDMNEGLRGALRQREGALERSFRRQTQSVNEQIVRQSRTLDRFERQASTGLAGIATGRGRLGALIGGGVAVGAGFKLAQGLRAGFNEAVNLNEAMNAVTQIFGEATDSVVDFTSTSVETLFLTQAEALKAAQSFGVFGKSAGLVGEELAGFSNELSLVAVDLASFYNTTVPEAVTSISAALRGESEPIRRFGVLLDEQILRQRALTEGIIDQDRQLQPSERVLAAYSEILRRTAVAQDDAARTADDFANASRRARAASITTFASIARFAVPVAEILLRGVIPALEGLNDFIEGDVGPALQILRTGLVGAAAGLGALLAVRGGVEVIQFLAIALRAVLTPMGLVVTAFAGLGAAIAILRDRSPQAVELFDRIRKVVTSGLLTGLERAAELFATIAEFVRTRIVPVFVGLAVIVARQIRPAFDFLADVVEERVLPVFRVIGQVLVRGLGVAIPLIAETVTQIIRLGRAIGSAFTGDFSGLASIGRDLVSGFQNLGSAIAGVVVPQIQRGVQLIVDLFNGIDWEALGLRALVLINTLGRVIGSIASDPRFVTALAAIAGAGVAAVGAFVLGVGEGIASNLDGLIVLLADGLTLALTEGFKVAASNPRVFLAVLTAGAFVAGLRSAFTAIGERGGGNFATGLGRGFTQAAGRLRAIALANPFTSTTATERFRRAGAEQARAYTQEFERVSRNARRLGFSVTPLRNGEVVNAARLRRATGELERMAGVFSTAQQRALLFRSTLRELFRPGSFANFSRSVGDAVRNINWGQLGRNSAVGFMFGYTAVISGKEGGTAGILGVTTSALAAGLSTGSPWVAAGVAAAGLIAFAFRDVKSSLDEARESLGSFIDIFETLDNQGDQAIEIGERIFDDIAKDLGEGVTARLLALYPDGILASIGSDIVLGEFESEDAFGQFLQRLELTEDQIRTLKELGEDDVFRSGFFRDAALALETADGSFPGVEARAEAALALEDALKREGLALKDVERFLDAFAAASLNAADGAAAAAEKERALEAARSGGISGARRRAFEERAAVQATRDLSQAQRDLIAVQQRTDTQSFFDRLVGPLSELFGGDIPRIFNAIVEAAREAGQAIDLDFLRVLLNGESSVVGFANGLLLNVDALRAARDAAVEQAREAIRTEVERRQGTDEWREAVDQVSTAYTQLRENTQLVDQAVESLNRQRTDALNAQIDTLTNRLDAASEAAQRARESLTDFITGKYQDTTAALVDDLIGGLDGIAESIVEARGLGGERGAAALRSIFGDLDAEIASIVQAGIEEGLSGQQIRDLFNPLNAALGEVVNPLTAIYDPENIIIPPEVVDRIFRQIDGDLDGRQIDINAGALFNAERQVQSIQDQLDAKRAELNTELRFSEDQIAEELRRAGLDQIQVDLIFGATDTDLAQADPLTQGVAAFQSAFGQLLLLLANANAQAPAGQEVNINALIQAPTTDPEDIADSLLSLADDRLRSSGGTTTRGTVIYTGTPRTGGGGLFS